MCDYVVYCLHLADKLDVSLLYKTAVIAGVSIHAVVTADYDVAAAGVFADGVVADAVAVAPSVEPLLFFAGLFCFAL